MDNAKVGPATAGDSTLGEETERLIERARAGSGEALGELLRGAREPLMRTANRELPRGLRSKEGLSDLVQETCLVAHRRFDQFNGRTRGEFVLWLKSILRHASLHLRRSFRAGRRELAREVRLDSQILQGEGPRDSEVSPSSIAARNETGTLLEAALGRVPDRDRQVLLWRHRDQLTFEEMGRRLAISTVGARNAWLRALRRLRDELD